MLHSLIPAPDPLPREQAGSLSSLRRSPVPTPCATEQELGVENLSLHQPPLLDPHGGVVAVGNAGAVTGTTPAAPSPGTDLGGHRDK